VYVEESLLRTWCTISRNNPSSSIQFLDPFFTTPTHIYFPLVAVHPLIFEESIPPPDVNISIDIEEITRHSRIRSKEFVPGSGRILIARGNKRTRETKAVPPRHNVISVHKIDPSVPCCVNLFEIVLVDDLIEV